MSEMQGVEQKQAETTKGISETTGAVKGVQSTIADGDRSIDAKLSMIGRVLSIESPTEKAARQQSSNAAREAQAYHAEMLQLQKAGGATEQQVLEAQRSMESTAEEAAEAAEKRSMFDRFGGDEAPTPPPSGGDGGGEDKETKKTGGAFGTFFKMIKGFVGILLAIAIPALALLLNSPVFKILKKALFDFIDFFFEEIFPILVVLKDKFFVAIDKIRKYFDENVLPILKDVKDKLFGVLTDLYDKVIEPIYDFFEEFMTREGGGFDILLKGLETAFSNFKAMFDDIINVISSLLDGDLAAVKDHILSLGANILKAVKDNIDTIIEFVLGMFGMQAKEGQGGMSMLKDVVKGFFKSIVDKISGVFDGLTKSISTVIQDIMSGIQNIARDIIGDTLGDKIFGKRAVKDLSVEEQQEERKDLTDDMKDTRKEALEKGKDLKEAKLELEKFEAEAKAKGGFDKIQKSGAGLSQNDIIEAREALQVAKDEEKEAVDKLKADQERLKKLNESLNAPAPEKPIEAKPAPEKLIEAKDEEKSDGKAANEIKETAANQNTPAPTIISAPDQSQKTKIENKTVLEQSKSLSPDARTSKLLDVGVF